MEEQDDNYPTDDEHKQICQLSSEIFKDIVELINVHRRLNKNSVEFAVMAQAEIDAICKALCTATVLYVNDKMMVDFYETDLKVKCLSYIERWKNSTKEKE